MNIFDTNRNRRILIIDDNQAIHDDIRKILNRRLENDNALSDAKHALFGTAPETETKLADYRIDSAFQGKQGLDMLHKANKESEPYAMAFVDIRMPPGWDGIETIEYLWKESPELQTVICTAFSDYSWEEISSRLKHADRLLILKKPFDNIEVRQMAQALTEKWTLTKIANAKRFQLEHTINQRTREIQKQADSLDKKEKKFRTLFETAPIGILISNKDGKILNVNSMLERQFGYQRNELRKKKIEILLPEKKRKIHVEHRQKYIANPRMRTQFENIDLFGRRKDGNLFPIEVGLSHTIYEDELMLMAFITDITERKKAETELRESEKRFEDIALSSADWIWEVDSEGRYTLAIGNVEKITGYKPDELIGKTPFDLMPEFERDRIEIIFSNIIKNKQSLIDLENWNETKDKQLICIQTNGIPMLDENNNLIGYRGVDKDITERKKDELELKKAKISAEAASRAKSEFLANMSHEIRTPMNGIIGLTDLLLHTRVDNEQLQYLKMVKGSASQLLSILNDILDFSKIEAGQLDLEKIEFNLRTSLESITDVVIHKAEKKGLEITLFIDKNVDIYLIGDPARLRQVVINLLGNAIKFTEKGQVTVSVKPSKKINHKTIQLHFSVSDSGIGIPEDRLKSVFKSFTQADSTTTRKYGGTGIGLTISKQLVEMMNGKIWVESTAGVGSTFHFLAQFGLQQNPIQPELTMPFNIRGIKVLAIDDHDTNRLILSEMLKSFKCHPVLVKNADSALKILANTNDINLIITDCHMPGIDGKQLTEKVRTNELYKKLPIIILTSVGKNHEVKKIEELGNIWTLTKPIKQSYLFDSIITAMGRSRQHIGRQINSKDEIDDKIRSLKKFGGKATILLAEDNLVNQKVATAVIKRTNIFLDIVEDGKLAIDAVRKKRYDIILMDVQMPVMDGLSATREIKKNKKYKKLPIIAMTAHAMKGDKEKCLSSGMDDYISKPIEPKELYSVLLKWLTRKK